MMAELRYRQPAPEDHPALLALFAEHGWKTDAGLLATLLAPANAVPLCACRDGRIVGFFLATRWGDAAWTGYLIVTQALRGQGVGAALKQRLLAELEAAGVGTFRNISRDGLRGFQARQGFEVERKVVLLEREGAGRARQQGPPPDIERLVAYDRGRFGAGRSDRLREHLARGLPAAALTDAEGDIRAYALAWPLKIGYRIGPVVHEPDVDAAALFDAVLDALPVSAKASVCLYADDEASLDAAARLGFSPYGEASQFIGGRERAPQDARVKAVWGRATG